MGSAVSARRRTTIEEENAVHRVSDPRLTLRRSLSTSKRTPLARRKNSASYVHQTRNTNGGAGKEGAGERGNNGGLGGGSSNAFASVEGQPVDVDGNLVLTEKMLQEYISLERTANRGKAKKEQLVAHWMEQSCPPVPNLFDQHALAMDTLRSRQNFAARAEPRATPVAPLPEAL